MTITLTPETENRLLQHAEWIGKDVNSLADTIIADGLSNGAFLSDPDTLTEDQIAELRAGIGRGLDAGASGRVKPIAQAIAEARQRHQLAPEWANGAEHLG